MSETLFMVEMWNIHYLCWARGREDAKRQAHDWIGSDPDHYIVTPLTEPGDRVTIQGVCSGNPRQGWSARGSGRTECEGRGMSWAISIRQASDAVEYPWTVWGKLPDGRSRFLASFKTNSEAISFVRGLGA